MANQREIKETLRELLSSLNIISRNISFVVNGIKQLLERLDKD
jgi:hypothetical protein